MSRFGSVDARLVNGELVIVRADDVVEVSGELAETFGVKPPLDGRIEIAPGYAYDLSAWAFAGTPGRIDGTYIGRRVTR